MLPTFFVCKPLHASPWHILLSRVKSDNRRDCIDWYDELSNTSVVSSRQRFQNLSPLTWYRRHVVNTNMFLAQCPSNLLQPSQPCWQRVQFDLIQHELRPWPTLCNWLRVWQGYYTMRGSSNKERTCACLAVYTSELLFPCGASDLSPGKCVMVVLQLSMLIAR